MVCINKEDFDNHNGSFSKDIFEEILTIGYRNRRWNRVPGAGYGSILLDEVSEILTEVSVDNKNVAEKVEEREEK